MQLCNVVGRLEQLSAVICVYCCSMRHCFIAHLAWKIDVNGRTLCARVRRLFNRLEYEAGSRVTYSCPSYSTLGRGYDCRRRFLERPASRVDPRRRPVLRRQRATTTSAADESPPTVCTVLWPVNRRLLELPRRAIHAYNIPCSLCSDPSLIIFRLLSVLAYLAMPDLEASRTSQLMSLHRPIKSKVRGFV